MIVNIDRKSRSINLSIKQKDAAEETAALQKHAAEQQRERRHHEPGRAAEGEALGLARTRNKHHQRLQGENAP